MIKRRINQKRIRISISGLMWVLIILNAADTSGVVAKKWTSRDALSDGRGDYRSVMVSTDGTIVCGHETEKRRHRQGYDFWAGTWDAKGRPIFGGGKPAGIFRFQDEHFKQIGIHTQSRDQRIETDGKSFAAIIFIPEHHLILAGMLGGGDILIQKEKDPALKRFTYLPVENIWDLKYDGSGSVYAATGPLGQVYRIDLKTGKAQVWGQVKDTNVRYLYHHDGKLYSGGGESGNLYEMSDSDHIKVAAHFEEESVERIIGFDDGIVVAANKMKQAPDEKREADYRRYFKQFSSLKKNFGVDMKDARSSDPKSLLLANLSKGSLYYVGKNYRIEKLMSLDEYILDMSIDRFQNLYLATGPNGRVYRIDNLIDDARKIWIAHDFDYRNVTAILMKNGIPSIFLASGNEAVTFIRAEQLSENGMFKTDVFSPGIPSQWGTLYWQGNDLIVYSRHGNTPVPDLTWTPWITRKTGSAGELDQSVWSFAQVKFKIGKTARFDEFEYYYMEKNQRPSVRAVKVSEKKSSDRGPVREVSWQINDPNGDNIVCNVQIRKDDMNEWINISGRTPIRENKYTLPTDTLPDGTYVLKVEASDRETNYSDGLTGYGLSQPFVIDNGRPVFIRLDYDGAQGKFSGNVEDQISVIAELSFALNGGDWTRFASADGILDQRLEGFELILPEDLQQGMHTIAFRAVDREGNQGGRIMTFTAPISKRP